ncbi:lipopolysaccharide assembly protein LapB [Winogradskyella sp.]|uniref:tetratricopeptide repeat protein n=1 Tax=Winogradskyella sp. TaxID=1883156 RepID=UPI0026089B13|nr:tetratricopeptide repeat protein [Winogradskyella sp.]
MRLKQSRLLSLLFLPLFFLNSIYTQEYREIADSLTRKINKNLRKSPDSIGVWSHKLLKTGKKLEDDEYLYFANRKLSYYYLKRMQFDSVDFYNKKTLANAVKLDTNKVVSTYQNFAAYYTEKSNTDSAFFYLEKAKNISERNLMSENRQDSIEKIEYLLMVRTAMIKSLIGKSDYIKALELTYDNLGTSIKYDINRYNGFNYYYLGLINLELGNYEEAEKYYLLELEYSKKKKNPNMEGFAYIHLGNVYLDREDLTKAEKYYNKAYDIFKKYEYKKGLLNIKKKLFTIYERQNNLEQAIEIGESYVSQYLKLKELDKYLSSFYIKLGRIYFLVGNRLKADKYISKALEFASTQSDEQNINIYFQAYKTYKANNNYKKALIYHEKLTKLRDSLLLNENFTNQLADANTKYETEKKEKELAQNEITILEQELELKGKQQTIWLISTILLAVLSLGLWFLYRRMKSKLEKQKLFLAFNEGLQHYLIHKYDLKEREYQLWLKIVDSLSEKELAEHFHKSIDTIKNWRKSLYGKLKSGNGQFRQKNAIDLYHKEQNLYKASIK